MATLVSGFDMKGPTADDSTDVSRAFDFNHTTCAISSPLAEPGQQEIAFELGNALHVQHMLLHIHTGYLSKYLCKD